MKQTILLIIVFGVVCFKPMLVLGQLVGYDALPEIVRADTFLTKILQDPEYKVELLVSPRLDPTRRIPAKLKEKSISYHYWPTPDYFYPASLVKLPTMLAALIKLNKTLPNSADWAQLRIAHLASGPCQTRVPAKGVSLSKAPLFKDYFKKICLVSDNDAYSRLYEFCGQAYLNDQLKQWGYPQVRIIQRFAPCDYQQNRRTNAIKLIRDGKVCYMQPSAFNANALTNPDPLAKAVGQGYFKNGKVYRQPMDFSKHNNLPLAVVHELFCQLMQRKVVGIRPDQQDSLIKWLGMIPRESDLAYRRNPKVYHDSYKKYLVYGAQVRQINADSLATSRIVNIVGQSHGWLSDMALIGNHVISVRIYCDNDGIIGDGKYTTQTVGMPFLKRLGEKYVQHFRSTD